MTNNGSLSQEEINALLNDVQSDSASESDKNNQEENTELYLTSIEKDTIGEIGNISLGSSATALSTLLGMKVEITTPTVSIVRKTGLTEEFPYEHVSLQVNYVEGFDGENIFLMKASDAAIISDIMLGGSGEEVNEELSDIALSAVQEAMNQMMGSSATSMSTVFSKRVDISPPVVEYEDIDKLEEVYEKIDEEVFVKVSFQLKVGDLIDSNIMQLIPLNFAKELVNNLLEPEPESIAEEQSESVLEEAEVDNIPAQQQATEQSKDEQDSEEPQQIGVKAQKNAPVQTASFSEFQPVDLSTKNQRNLDMLLDVPLQVTVELGRTRQNVSEILELASGSIIELDKLAGEPVDVLVNNKLIAKGEVVVIEENFGVRVTDIVSKADRLKNLN
ncbi:MAG TPA: flagellar motor switch phosphatase FliY [Pseudogracilibacillus sp.]|nr:flagellar motor switch phosphatase FliY [Pseudogracilibacillus sp.]